MELTELATLLGLPASATDADVRAALATLAQTTRASILEEIGLSATATDEELRALSQRASDGSAYREDLLAQLERLTIATTHGDPAEAEAVGARARRIWARVEIDDLRAEVTRLQATKQRLYPEGRQSTDAPDEETKQQPVSYTGA